MTPVVVRSRSVVISIKVFLLWIQRARAQGMGRIKRHPKFSQKSSAAEGVPFQMVSSGVSLMPVDEARGQLFASVNFGVWLRKRTGFW